MFYFENYLRAGGVQQLGRVSILHVTDEAWVYETLRGEIGDVFPDVVITVDPESSVPSPIDLLVVPLMAPHAFPFHDVVYQQLDLIARVSALRHGAAHVLFYRARWREVEVVASSAVPALLRRRRIERWLIQRCDGTPWLRRLLRPRYPN